MKHEPPPYQFEWRLLPPWSIQNISFDPQGRVYRLTQSRLRRWWQARRGWTHYIGHHYSSGSAASSSTSTPLPGDEHWF